MSTKFYHLFTKFLCYICLLLLCCHVASTAAEIKARMPHATNNNIHQQHNNFGFNENSSGNFVDEHTNNQSPPPPPAPPAPASSIVNTDIIDKMSWQCANNASCLYSLANSVLQSYKRGETVNFGILSLVKLPPAPVTQKTTKTTNSKTKSKSNLTESGRGISAFTDFISGNAIRVPVGPMVFSIQRAEDDVEYIEIALLKKATPQGRQSSGKAGGGLLGVGGLGGGGGGGIGGGSGIGGGDGLLGGGRRRKNNHDKKQFQMYIPLYLAASTFGWTLVAVKAVGLLTLKALVISKLAFLVTAMIIIKKMMDNASDKMLYQYPEHPYIMPYSMDYPLHAIGGAELATNEMYPAAALHLAAAAPLHHGHGTLEGLAAESNLHHNIAEVQNNTHVLAALNAAGLGQKIKREDAWVAKTATLPRPMVYNYLHSQHPYYRT